MKMKMKMKNKSHRYGKNRSRYEQKSEKKCHGKMMFICIKQHLSNNS